MASTLNPFFAPPLPSPQPPQLKPCPRNPIPTTTTTHHSFHLLEICADPRELHQILPHVIKSNLLSHHPFQTKLVSLFSRFGLLHQASLVFEPIDRKIDELYFSILKGHAKHSSLNSALEFFVRMRIDGVAPSVHCFTYLLKSCGDNSDLRRGRELHSMLVASGFAENVFAMTVVVNMYVKCGEIGEVRKVFDRMIERDLVSWNAVIAGYTQNDFLGRALDMVRSVHGEGLMPDAITLVSILPSCVDIGSLRIGRSVHGRAVRAGFERLITFLTALVAMYSKCGAIGSARLVFDAMRVRNVVSWNVMIDGYAQNGDPVEALRLFEGMLGDGLNATDATVLSVLHACAELGDLERGMFVHDLAVQLGLGSDNSVLNALITMYSKCKRVDIAEGIFENLEKKTLVSWNSIILGYAQNGKPYEALAHFREMREKNMKPDSFTMVSVIPALSEISSLRLVKWIHGYAIKSWLDNNVYVATALVDMYAKCGSICIARALFEAMEEQHLMTWNAMIDGYGMHGIGRKAIELFEEMRKERLIKPNEVTFLCVLSACSHSGLVEEAERYFKLMRDEYELELTIDVYGTMVDLLGRAGRLEEACKFIEKMPIEPDISVYGAMLGACTTHKNILLGEKAAKRLFELGPEEGGYHVLLSNIYANASMWEEMGRVRKAMEDKGLQKTPGWSSIELKNKVYTFYSGSTTHPKSEEVYSTLDELMEDIGKAGYRPNVNSIHDVEDDMKVSLLRSHSEKLAIAFGLISTSPGTTIHVRKNLRVCDDCHDATKFISLVTQREIIVRDMQWFHHFKDGRCSCGDYW
ncbi:Pentatricopeptide repeat-containing protein [Acorus calamus]|uniref:Pentatricopeptide repeat-containing protein n=1 Tax=Acorus calamus TaxID=4465 RepID=A0AAV9F808_ACOCL|nr:Pentatricopeptide repeat-containing protein [Acorus calamus]